jgi:hypothetical protein
MAGAKEGRFSAFLRAPPAPPAKIMYRMPKSSLEDNFGFKRRKSERCCHIFYFVGAFNLD